MRTAKLATVFSLFVAAAAMECGGEPNCAADKDAATLLQSAIQKVEGSDRLSDKEGQNEEKKELIIGSMPSKEALPAQKQEADFVADGEISAVTDIQKHDEKDEEGEEDREGLEENEKQSRILLEELAKTYSDRLEELKAGTACTMADVFGEESDDKKWPSTVDEAKSWQRGVCRKHGYGNNVCDEVLDVHFSDLKGSDKFVLTPKFCKESVELLRIDAIHHQGSSAELVQSSRKLGCRRRKRGTFNCNQVAADVIMSILKSICFPSDAAVSAQLQDGTVAARTMEQLRVGDVVLTQTGPSKIFAFMDHDANAMVNYVRLETASGHELSISADHIVFAHAEQSPVLAGSIVKGDYLWITADATATFLPSRVVSIVHTVERGVHAPLTEQGTVVVNGVLSSSYANVKNLRWGDKILLTGHGLNKHMHEPLRLACALLPSLCGPEWHGVEGRHAWTQFILDNFGWLEDMNGDHSDFQAALMKPSVSSLLAVLTQLIAAGLLFGSTSLILLLGMFLVAQGRKGRGL